MSRIFHYRCRQLQDTFDSRRIADRLEAVTTRAAFSEGDRAFITGGFVFATRSATISERPSSAGATMAIQRPVVMALAVMAVCGSADAQEGGCAPGTRCLATDNDGSLEPDGDLIAQCSGNFPDFTTLRTRLAQADGPWFRLAQDYPAGGTDRRCAMVCRRLQDIRRGRRLAARAARLCLRGHDRGGLPAQGQHRVPLITFGPLRANTPTGLAEECQLVELGLKDAVRAENFAIGFYDASGAATIGRVWANSARAPVPDLAETRIARRDERVSWFKGREQ